MPVRLNSSRVPQKSILPLAKRPLFCWVAETVCQLQIPLYIYSTSNAKLRGLVDFEGSNLVFLDRDSALDSDATVGMDIYKQFAHDVVAKIYLLVHATSPFTSATTFRRVLEPVCSGKTDSAFTVRKVQTFCWHNGKAVNFSIPRRQTQLLEPVYAETSAAYCFTRELIFSGRRSGESPALVEVEEAEALDIDTQYDFKLAEALASNRRNIRCTR